MLLIEDKFHIIDGIVSLFINRNYKRKTIHLFNMETASKKPVHVICLRNKEVVSHW